MNTTLKLLMALISVISLAATASTSSLDNNTGSGHYQPQEEHLETSKQVFERLTRRHYRRLKVNDAYSERVFEQYLRELDPQRIYFTSADIQEFEKWRKMLDDGLRVNNIDAGFEIYNRYNRRFVQRLEWNLATLEKGLNGLDFEREESVLTDREEADRASDTQELEDLWRRLLKNTVLGMRLNEKTFEEIATTLVKRYSNRLKRSRQITADDVFERFMNAYAGVYDPHTHYYSPQGKENFDIDMRLSLQGIGAVLRTDDDYTKVVRIVPSGPADKSGKLHAADRILAVGQGLEGPMEDIIGARLQDVVGKIRGAKGTKVRLEIIPANEEDENKTRIITIVRDEVKLEEQAARKTTLKIDYDGDTRKLGVIDLPTFYADFECMRNGGRKACKSSTRDVQKLIEELQDEQIEGLIIDLRGNSGGALHEANSLTGLFIDTGPTVQVQDARKKVSIFGDTIPGSIYSGPLIVLVDRLSASASEIFAGAIQDYGRGIIMGEQTFGKGTVQTLLSIEDGGQLKTTSAKYYRITGRSTQHQGVIPHIKYPTLIDSDKVGESSLENALAYDKIKATRYRRHSDIGHLLPELITRNNRRNTQNPDFIFKQDRLAQLAEIRARSSLSLKESSRKKLYNQTNSELLRLENTRRQADGEETFKSYTEYRDHQEKDLEEQEASSTQELEIDAVLESSAFVLMDFIELAAPAYARH